MQGLVGIDVAVTGEWRGGGRGGAHNGVRKGRRRLGERGKGVTESPIDEEDDYVSTQSNRNWNRHVCDGFAAWRYRGIRSSARNF